MTKTVISLVLFFVSFVLLSYKLDYGSLEPWDEAWYAEVSRNVLRGDIFIMKSNGSTYIDHPPLGYWVEGLFFKVLGESEYSARLPSVIFGCLTIVLVFLLGSKISGMKAGLAAVLILFTSRWFLLRSRTGNLEPLLMFLQLSAVYLSWYAKKISSIYLAWFLFGLSFLVKTFASVTLLPLMIYNTALFHKDYPLSAENVRNLILFFAVPTGIWYAYNTVIFGRWFIEKNIFTVGLRKGDMNGLTWSNISSTLLLLRSVIHRWFTPFILSYLLSFLLFFRKLD
ncbi:glycosyltransferase family 39 protein, partial [Candidatus Microgenomates bacterium]|nr:glycosyltransferase family 39 protein [Candidatus Microgenomates bacterium]